VDDKQQGDQEAKYNTDLYVPNDGKHKGERHDSKVDPSLHVPVVNYIVGRLCEKGKYDEPNAGRKV